jgi:hypothetical protein
MNGVERVTVSRRLTGAVSAMQSEKNTIARVKITNEVVRILASLGVSSKPKSIYADITSGDAKKAFDSINALLEKDSSDEAKLYAGRLAGLAYTLATETRGTDESRKLFDLAMSSKDTAIEPIRQDAQSRGKELVSVLSGDLDNFKANQSATDQLYSHDSVDISFAKDFIESLDDRSKEYGNVMLELVEKLQSFTKQGITSESLEQAAKQLERGEISKQEYDATYGEFSKFRSNYNLVMGKLRRTPSNGKLVDWDLVNSSYRKQKEAEKQLFDNAYGLVASKSKVTDKEADEWANKQTLTKTAKTRLARYGYKEADIRRDMAEFYKLTNGRVKAFTIDSNSATRAHTHGVGNMQEKPLINVGSDFNKRVLWHEMAHHLETDPVAMTVAGNYIRSKSEDGKLHTLRSLTGNSGFRKDEVAYKDGFFHPYIGKVYEKGSTEVFSMVMESFSNPDLLANRMAKDPDTFAVVMGFLTRDKSQIEAVFDATLEDSLNAVVGKQESIEEAYKRAVKAYAQKAKIDTPNDAEKSQYYHAAMAVIVDGVRYLLNPRKVRNAKGRLGSGYEVLLLNFEERKGKMMAAIPTTKENDVLAMMGMVKRFSGYFYSAKEFADQEQVVKWAVEDGVITL